MAYHTMLFLLVFLPLILICYQIAGTKYRPYVLLAAGYIFFTSFSGILLLYLLGATVIMYAAGLWIDHIGQEFKEKKNGLARSEVKQLKKKFTGKKRAVLCGSLVLLVGVLFIVKYYNFFAENLSAVFRLLTLPICLKSIRFLQPIGISFYTLQAVSSVVDIYEGKNRAEWQFGKVALYMAFFPQIMEGPISRFDQTADQLWKGTAISSENLTMGAQRVLWGLFKKIVIADRLDRAVGVAFLNYQSYDGAILALAAVAYTVQLYNEFSGCMDIVIGVAEMFGVVLPENFRQPFLSKNVSEFWRRWHITLGAWLKDYIFYPVSLTGWVQKLGTRAKARFGKHGAKVAVSAAALFPVWLLNGLWHGQHWNYIFFGMYYFILIMAGILCEPLIALFYEKCGRLVKSKGYAVFQIVRTSVLVVIGEMIFRANGAKAAIVMLKTVFGHSHMTALGQMDLPSFGIDRADIAIVLCGVILVTVVGLLHERGISIRRKIATLSTPARWCCYYVMILLPLIFGAFGDGYLEVELIYANF